MGDGQIFFTYLVLDAFFSRSASGQIFQERLKCFPSSDICFMQLEQWNVATSNRIVIKLVWQFLVHVFNKLNCDLNWGFVTAILSGIMEQPSGD
jgi:hypothetical protein